MTFVVITDGRGEYLERALASGAQNLPGFRPVIVNDAGDPHYTEWLQQRFPSFSQVHHPERRGLAAAVRSAWQAGLATGGRFVFHLEDDFVLNGPIDLDAMCATLDANPHLAQLVLKRQPWSDEEKRAGGQIEVSPLDYEDCDGFVQHRRLFSFNPSLICRGAIQVALTDPESDGLEQGVTDALRHSYWFAYWGKRDDPPRATHIGEHRTAGYRW